MDTPARGRNRHRLGSARRRQTGNEVVREEWCIGGHADHPLEVPIGRIIQPGDDSSQRTGVTGDVVGHDRQCGGSQPRRVAIGVQDDGVHLRTQALDDVGEKRTALKQKHPLVAAAHSPRQTAGQDETEDRLRG